MVRGRVTRVESGVGVWVLVPSLGGMEVGPLEHDGTGYAVGDRVVMADLDDGGMVVLARLTTVLP